MNLEQWLENGWLRQHETSPQEISNQFEGIDQDLRDASQDLSAAWKYAIAYNAALRLCASMLHLSGYRAARSQRHFRTITSLPMTLGEDETELARYLDKCRVKRHELTYEKVMKVSLNESEELIETVQELRAKVLQWIRVNHPEYI